MSELSTDTWSSLGIHMRVTGPGLPAQGESVEIARPYARVGSADNNDVKLGHDDVSRWHVYLQRIGDGVLFVDLGSRIGTLVGGQAAPRGWVSKGKPLSVGPYHLHIDAAEVATPYDPFRRKVAVDQEDAPYSLQFTGRTGKIINQPLNRELSILGRDAPSNLIIPDDTISRTHVLFYQTAGKLWIVNLSGFFCYRDDHKIDGQLLHPGDRLRLGQFYIVDILPKSTPATPAADASHLVELQALQSESARLQSVIDEVQSERDHQIELASAARTELENLQVTISDLDQRLETLNSELVDHKSQVSQARQALQESENERDLLRRQIEEFTQQVPATNENEAKFASLQVELEAEKSNAQQLKQRLEELTTADAEKTVRIESTQNELVNAHAQLASIEEKLTQERTHAEQSRAERDTLQVEFDSFREQTKARESNLAEKIHEVERYQSEIQRLEQDRTSLQEQAGNTQVQFDTLQSQLLKLQKERDEAVSKCQQLQSRLDETESERTHKVEEINALRQQITESDRSEFDTLMLPVGHADRHAETDLDLKAARRELQKSVEEMENLNRTLADLRVENTTYAQQVHVLEQAVQNAEERLASREQHLRSEIDRLSAEIVEHQRSLADKEEQLVQFLPLQASQAEDTDAVDVEALQSQILQLQQDNEQLKLQRDEFSQELQALRQHNAEVESKLEKLTGEVSTDDYFSYLSRRREGGS